MPDKQESMDFITTIPDHAGKFVQTCKEVFNIDMDYSVQSIKMLDGIIDRAWDGKQPNDIDNMIILFGSYLGEAIKKNHGGEWDYDENFGIVLKNFENWTITIFPFDKVRKKFLEGKDESLTFYYQTALYIIAQEKAMKVK